MSNVLRGIKRTIQPVKNKCCGRHMVEKEIETEDVTASGEIVKKMRMAYVCEACGRGVWIDQKGKYGVVKKKA